MQYDVRTIEKKWQERWERDPDAPGGGGGGVGADTASSPVESQPRALTNLLTKSSSPFIFLTPMITHPCRR